MGKKKKADEEFPEGILCHINSPADLKEISEENIPRLAEEIRQFLIEKVTKNGGHLASNLCSVELTLALHRVFDSPKDHIIWDIGHQSYVHKMITGRRDEFDTLRTPGGLSGFTKRSESEHDPFGAGHSSTSLSAALGFAEADKLSGSDAFTVAVIGDGAYTGGMIHEALNNCDENLKLIIVINENEMSISKNIGAFARSLSKLRSGRGYFGTKNITKKILIHLPLVGKPLYRFTVRVKKMIKDALYGSNDFENLGLFYYGPIDGNNEGLLEKVFDEAKKSGKSAVIHIKTTKGKGYPDAENDPSRFHSLKPAGVSEGKNFSSAFGEAIEKLAQKNEKICAVTAAMGSGTGLDGFAAKYPDRFFDVGIAEEHAVTFAAGLCAAGFKPVTAIYSTFLQRSYDNIIHDVALQNLPVVFCIDRAGLNQSDGATHHGIFDVSFLSAIPGMKIYTPVTFDALGHSLEKALKDNCPSAIRYPNTCENNEIVSHFYSESSYGNGDEIGIRSDFAPGEEKDTVIISAGKIAAEAIKAQKILAEKGIDAGLILCEFIKPYSELRDLIAPYIQKTQKIVTVEEEIRAGGFGMMLSDELLKRNDGTAYAGKIKIVAVDDNFVIQSKNEPIYESAGVSAKDISRAVESL